jgi:hypothetical protein
MSATRRLTAAAAVVPLIFFSTVTEGQELLR